MMQHTPDSRPPRLFIPGPVEVEAEIREQLARPVIGHRGPEISELLGEVDPLLRHLFRSEHPAYIATNSATALMEASLRNCVRERVLCCVNGAFSERWFEICAANGIAADALEFDWGQPVLPNRVAEALARGEYDAITVVHSETSTGVMSPLKEIAEVVRQHDDLLLLVDGVTSLAVVPIETEAWGIDVIFTGSHKGLALPPGLSVYSVSPRALERARAQPQRGFYLDFLLMEKSRERRQTPFTPAMPLIYALRKRLQGILADPERWYGEHLERARWTRNWAKQNFALYPDDGYESVSLTCIVNNRDIRVTDLIQYLRGRGVQIANGYGQLKEKTFRIGHMGANDLAAHQQLLSWIDEWGQRGRSGVGVGSE
ncbi:MAG: alanine--glyoxylate aminotransferase family protein [Planctomycetota bacterium]